MEQVLKQLWRVAASAVLLILISYVSFSVLNASRVFPPADVPWLVLMAWFVLSCLLTAAVLVYVTVRSRWTGTQLMCAVFVAFFGIRTFVNISQAFLLVPHVMTPPRAAVLAAHGFLVALMFSFVLVLVTGRLGATLVLESPRLHLPAREWLGKLVVCTVAYCGLSVLAQAVAASRLPDFYARGGMVPWWERAMLYTGRALLLVAFVLPVVKMLKGGRWEAALAVGLLFCILGGLVPLMVPGGTIEDAVRYTFMVTGGTTDLLYGLLVGYLFSREPARV
jgi:hypothetical protein